MGSRKAGYSIGVFGGCKKYGSSFALWSIFRERRVRHASYQEEMVQSWPPSSSSTPSPNTTQSSQPPRKALLGSSEARHVPTPSVEMLGYSGKGEASGAGGGTYSSVTSFGMPLGRARSPLLLHRTTVSTQVHCSGQRGLSWQLLSSLPAENPHGVSLVEDEPRQENNWAKLADRARLFTARASSA